MTCLPNKQSSTKQHYNGYKGDTTFSRYVYKVDMLGTLMCLPDERCNTKLP